MSLYHGGMQLVFDFCRDSQLRDVLSLKEALNLGFRTVWELLKQWGID
jgi:hypothetical protein